MNNALMDQKILDRDQSLAHAQPEQPYQSVRQALNSGVLVEIDNFLLRQQVETAKLAKAAEPHPDQLAEDTLDLGRGAGLEQFHIPEPFEPALVLVDFLVDGRPEQA